MRSQRGTPLELLRRSLVTAWTATRKDGTVRRFLARAGYVGDARNLQVALSTDRRWQTGLNVLLFTEQPLRGDDLTAFQELAERVIRRWLAAQGGSLTPRGVNAEIADAWTVQDIIARLELRPATPRTLLALAGAGDPSWWREYTAAMKKARLLTWGGHIRDRYPAAPFDGRNSPGDHTYKADVAKPAEEPEPSREAE
jgi:hypothetical protein